MTQKILQEARGEMGLEGTPGTDIDKQTGGVRAAAARCWTFFLARIFEGRPLRCPRCGEPMRILAFVLDRGVSERILSHIGEPTEAPVILLARSPPQGELVFSQAVQADPWFGVDQTGDLPEESWE